MERQHLLLQYSMTLSKALATARTHELPHHRPGPNQLSHDQTGGSLGSLVLPAQVTHFFLCPETDHLPGILLAKPVSESVVIFDVPLSCSELIQSCLKDLDGTF